MSQASTTYNQKGFTLIELLVVSALLAILSTILYSTISGILSGRSLILSQREVTTLTQTVMERLTRELTARLDEPLQVDGTSPPPPTSPTANPFARAGGRNSLIGKNKRQNSLDADTIRFVTSNEISSSGAGTPNFGPVEVEYRLEEFRRPGDTETRYALLREEKPLAVPSKIIREKRAKRNIIVSNIHGLNFRYLKENNWEKEWRRGANGSPDAVEISLTFSHEDGSKETFRTAVRLFSSSR